MAYDFPQIPEGFEALALRIENQPTTCADGETRWYPAVVLVIRSDDEIGWRGERTLFHDHWEPAVYRAVEAAEEHYGVELVYDDNCPGDAFDD